MVDGMFIREMRLRERNEVTDECMRIAESVTTERRTYRSRPALFCSRARHGRLANSRRDLDVSKGCATTPGPMRETTRIQIRGFPLRL